MESVPVYAAHDLVFADARGEPWRADGVTKSAWTPMLRRLNLPRVRLYDARHSCATMLLEAGQPMKVVQGRIVNANMQFTLKAEAGGCWWKDTLRRYA